MDQYEVCVDEMRDLNVLGGLKVGIFALLVGNTRDLLLCSRTFVLRERIVARFEELPASRVKLRRNHMFGCDMFLQIAHFWFVSAVTAGYRAWDLELI